MDQSELYEFGAFRLDVRNARLLKGSETISLPPKTFDVLVVLVKHAGELVEKDVLMREVWPDTFVEEANISRHIWTLRKALGDDSLIETQPRRGYRLNAPARPQAGPQTHPRIVPPASSSRWWLWAAATAAAAGLVWVAWSAVPASRPAAMRWFALAETSRIEGRFRDAVPLYQRAIELDPEFALAESRLADVYGALREPSARHAHALRAYALRDRASERERLFIDATYHAVLGDRPRQAAALQLLIKAYPGEAAAHAALAVVYRETGRFEPALDRAREAARLDPGSADARALVARALVDLNRFTEARSSVEADRDSPSEAMHAVGFELAFMRGDRDGMERELAWAARSVNEDAAAQWQAQMHDFLGQRARARALFARTRVLMQTLGGDQRIAEVEALNASRDAIVGICRGTESKPGGTPTSPTFNTLTLAALARALCGDVAAARALAGELTLSSSLDWLNRTVSVPIIRAFIDASAGVAHDAEAVNAVARTIEPYELGQTLWPIYLRGLVHAKTGRFDDAAAAFRRILAQRGPAGLSIRYPLAHLQLARALARTGDRAGSRTAYEDFLRVWKDADPDLPILIDARKEYAETGR